MSVKLRSGCREYVAVPGGINHDFAQYRLFAGFVQSFAHRKLGAGGTGIVYKAEDTKL